MSSYQPQNRVVTRQEVRVDPSVVLRSKVLALTLHELEQAIELELSDNPALERLDSEAEVISDEAVLRTVAPQELRRQSDDSERFRCTAPDDLAVDWTEMAQTTNSLHDHVRAQLLALVETEQRSIANYMVDCLNGRGYLESSLDEIAMEIGSTPEATADVHAQLIRCEPAGIGARNLIECLVLQLRHAETVEENLAVVILTGYLDDFLARKTSRISKRFKVLPNVVEASFDTILALNPNPGEEFATCPTSLMTSHSAAVAPDLTLRLTEAGWEIEPKGGDPSCVCVNPAYKQRLKKLRNDRFADNFEVRHVGEYVQRAEQFIQTLKDRRRTMRQIGAFLVERQSGFVSTGRYEFLTPLTRAQLAHEIGVHESTISRATMGKFVQIANGEVVSFEVFFKPALRIQKLIEEILQQENPNTPLSDDAISKVLEERGVFVARRTVNKYRDKTRMLNSRTRRTA